MMGPGMFDDLVKPMCCALGLLATVCLLLGALGGAALLYLWR